MKKLFFSILLTLPIYGFCQIPSLIERTMSGKLKPSDFEKRDYYMVNVDTLKWEKELFSGDFTYYYSKTEMIDKINSFVAPIKNKKIDYFIELKDNLAFYPRKFHTYALIENYRIDWWFSTSGSNELETITLTKKNSE